MRVHSIALLAGLVGAEAHAADVVFADPAATVAEPSPFTWSGLYVGVNSGYAFGEELGLNESSVSDVDGFIGGVQVGYNYQFDRFVFGVEADIQLSGQQASANLAPIGVPGVNLEQDYNYWGTLRGRAGVAFDRALIYGTGGFAFGETEYGFNPAVLDSEKVSLHGWTLGAGVEYAFAEKWSAKAEYLYVSFNDDEVFGIPLVDTEFSTVRVGVNYRF